MQYFKIILLSLIFLTVSTYACTEIKLTTATHQSVIAHNFDWPDKLAFIIVNPRGVKHSAQGLGEGQNPLHWVAKYGSVTIAMTANNHPLQEAAMPTGINEKGLSASILWLDNSRYPHKTYQDELTTGQWAQYYLD